MEATALVERLQQLGIEPTDVEVKAAGEGLPSSVSETISASANGTGGTLLLGIDEASGFEPANGFDARAIRDAFANACANKVDPPCRAPIEIQECEGERGVRLDVPKLAPVENPCIAGTRVTYGDSFIRGDNGDRRLTHYEVTQLLSNRARPVFDHELVPAATAAELDSAVVAHLPDQDPRAFPGAPGERGRVPPNPARRTDRKRKQCTAPDRCRAALLRRVPARVLPQLFVSFIVLPRLRMGETGPDGRRFLDNATITGPISTIVAGVAAFAIRNMQVGAIIVGTGRETRHDYPLDVIRGLIVNALMHRDYSPHAQGAQVQIELVERGLIARTSPVHSSRQSYRLVDQEDS